MKEVVRRAVYRALKASGITGLRRSWRVRTGKGWGTILVFHTLSETYAHDGITVSPRHFSDIARMLRNRYDVISLTDLLSRVVTERPLTGREVVITFDDGYLDNYQFAAPILLDLGLPATFYLTAGFIGTARQFAWDTAKGRKTVMMSWAHAREMHGMGFDIGCHTWNHPDLGTEPIASSRRELSDARARIQDETGSAVQHFAYPFGGLANITPEWVKEIREAGFASNVRCHGGHVMTGDDPFWIARLGCHQRNITGVMIELDRPW